MFGSAIEIEIPSGAARVPMNPAPGITGAHTAGPRGLPPHRARRLTGADKSTRPVSMITQNVEAMTASSASGARQPHESPRAGVLPDLFRFLLATLRSRTRVRGAFTGLLVLVAFALGAPPHTARAQTNLVYEGTLVAGDLSNHDRSEGYDNTFASGSITPRTFTYKNAPFRLDVIKRFTASTHVEITAITSIQPTYAAAYSLCTLNLK